MGICKFQRNQNDPGVNRRSSKTAGLMPRMSYQTGKAWATKNEAFTRYFTYEDKENILEPHNTAKVPAVENDTSVGNPQEITNKDLLSIQDPAIDKNSNPNSPSSGELFNPQFSANMAFLFQASKTLEACIKDQKLFAEDSVKLRTNIKIVKQEVKRSSITEEQGHEQSFNQSIFAIRYVIRLYPTKKLKDLTEEWILQACLKHHRVTEELQINMLNYELCMKEYLGFLKYSVKNMDKQMKPSPLARFMWQAHMQEPVCYQQDMINIFGFVLDHEDKEVETINIGRKPETTEVEPEDLS